MVSYEEGQQIALDTVITYALVYYSACKNRKAWGQKSAEGHIMALTTTMEDLRDAKHKLANLLAGVKKGRQKKNSKKTMGQEKKVKKNDSKRYPKLADIKPVDPKLGWMVKPPGA
eukprot:419342-Ditylum_brightwellii.AAC.1